MTSTNRRVVPLFVIAVTTFLGAVTLSLEGQTRPPATEAPAAFDSLSNGMLGPTRFAAVLEVFDEHEGTDDGLGPVYNAQRCGECHQNPVTGGIS